MQEWRDRHPVLLVSRDSAWPPCADFYRGDEVSFPDRDLQTHVRIITRSNPKTASDNGTTWRVCCGGKRPVSGIG